MVFNRIHGGGKASVSIVNGFIKWDLVLEGLSAGMQDAFYKVTLDENGEAELENVPAGGYQYYYAGTVGGNGKTVRFYSGHNVLDLSK